MAMFLHPPASLQDCKEPDRQEQVLILAVLYLDHTGEEAGLNVSCPDHTNAPPRLERRKRGHGGLIVVFLKEGRHFPSELTCPTSYVKGGPFEICIQSS